MEIENLKKEIKRLTDKISDIKHRKKVYINKLDLEIASLQRSKIKFEKLLSDKKKE